MDLSTIHFERGTAPRDDGAHEDYEIPWTNNEIEAFRSFLIGAKQRFGGGERHSDTSRPEAKNLCIIRGQTGSGKVTTVRRLCRDLRVKLVEFDPFNTALSTNREFDHTIDHLVRFLQSTLSRKSLRTRPTQPAAPANLSAARPLTGGKGVKRVRRGQAPAAGAETPGATTLQGESGSQLILICDLPRAILNCRYAALYPLQSLLKEATMSDDCHPVAIVSTNATDDVLILRRILPTHYAKSPRCLALNLREVSKPKIRSILRLDKKNKLLDHIAEIAAGDIRYVLNNAAFYHGALHAGFNPPDEELEKLKDHMLERNNNNTFNLLKKVLFNKRVPVTVTPGAATLGNGVGGPALEEDYANFLECFAMCNPVDNDTDEPDRHASASSLGAVVDSGRYRDKASTHLHRLPTKVRMYGLTEEFDPNAPAHFTKWPKLEPEADGVNFRHVAAKLIPKATRPLVFYSPDQLIESIKGDHAFFASSIFDNYSDLFGHIDDCTALTRHFVAADVFLSSHRNFGDPEVARWFLEICLRAAADANIYGFDSHKAEFHSFVTHSRTKSSSEQIRSLYRDFRAETLYCEQPNTYSQDTLFVEMAPTLAVVASQQHEEWAGERTQSAPTEDDYSIVDVMDQVERMLERGLEQGPERPEAAKQATIFTPKFNEMLQELGRHYNPQERDGSDETDGSGQA